MSNLIQDVTKEFPEFWDLPISMGGVSYGKTQFDKTNISLVLEHLIGNSDNFLLIVYPHDPTITPVSFIEGLISLLKRDVLAEDSEVLSGIEIGDSVVVISGRTIVPGIYLGIEKGSDGITRHQVREDVKASSPVTHGIPISRQWTIQPYSQAGTKKNKRQAEAYGERLEKILKLPPGGLLAFQKSKMLFVAKNKGQLKEDLSGVNLGGDPLTAVFSVADYVSDKKFVPIGRDPLRREPTGGLVSNLDHAVDIALSDKSIRLIMVDGASKLRSHFGSLERLRNDSDSCRVICLLNAEDEDQITTLKKIGAQAWIWKRSDFSEMKAEDLQLKVGNPVAVHNNILNYLGGVDPQIFTVEQSPELTEAINASFDFIRKISGKTEGDLDCTVLLRWSVSLINNMLQLPIPVSDYHNYVSTLEGSNYLRLDEKLKSIEKKVKSSYGFSVPLDTKDEWEQLLSRMRLIYKLLKQENPKWIQLLQLIEGNESNGSLSILTFEENYSNAIKFLYPRKFRSILSGAEVGNTQEDKVIITGWKNKNAAAKLFLAPYRESVYLLYPQENQRYSKVLRMHPASPETNIDEKLRSSQGIKSRTTDDGEITGGADISGLLNDLELKLSDSLYKAHLQEYGEENITDVRRIVFEENHYSYVTENQTLHRLVRESRSIEKCQLGKVSPGDELVFAESQRNMFEELLSIISQSEQYKLLFSDVRLWHESLLGYMEENVIDDEELSAKLSSIGCNIGIGTLKSWIKGDLISPSEKNLRDLAKIISDSHLNKNLEHVISSARRIHSLHIQTGRLLVRKIISAVVQDDDTGIDKETQNRIEEYSKKARIVTVREINPDIIKVPAKAIGKLFEF